MQSIFQTVPLNFYYYLSATLFCIGVLGVLTRRNAIIIFMSIELMLNSVNLLLVALSTFKNDPSGQVFVFFIMAVAGRRSSGWSRDYRDDIPELEINRYRPVKQAEMVEFAWLIPVLPLLGFLVNGLLGNRLPKTFCWHYW